MDRKKARQVFSQAGDVDNIYLNCTILGPPAVGTINGIIAEFDAMRQQPILARPSDYYMSIVRMSCPLLSAPLMTVPLLPPPAPANTTPWFVGINSGGLNYNQPILYQSGVYRPPEFFATDQIYSWTTFVSMVNVAMAAAYAAFQAGQPAAPQAVANQAPFLIWNPSTQLFSWVWHNSWATTPPAVEPLVAGQARVTMNNALLAVFNGFRVLLTAQVPGMADASYVWENTGDNAYTLNSYINTSFTVQNWLAISDLTTTKRIVVTSSTLPVTQEAVSTTVPGSQASNGSSSVPIVTDFEIQTTTSSDVRSTVFYTPTAQYRLTDLNSDQPLYRIQLSFFYQNSDGTLHPIIVSRNQEVSVKILFVKRHIYGKLSVPEQTH